ncbi:hypothetical protein MJ1_0609 [Nanobdella aerobiophila]|uniref:Uncharacterized protein n=1 Tax=Nanobdella aerobiophila TaxID=2586965 RepID=A0A915SSZ8_9ARCH|nr:hypothetical protein [Nanobdella aerobiophila]BBL45756.1 hypothetical protein MJ1_0609 [Nanobdella aerobiophila]
MVFKRYYAKIKKIKERREKEYGPYWATVKKFGRLTHPIRLK